MRMKNFVPSQESRDKASRNNGNSVAITTPFGDFISIHAAARAYGEDKNSIRYYCKVGEEQRRGESLIDGRSGKARPDFTGFILHGVGKCTTTGRKVQTPLGVFDFLKDAAIAHGITPSAIVQKISTKRPGFSYVQ